jgi:DNA modification methylase
MSEKIYGPANPHPLSQLRTELVWEGKYDEYGNRREIDIAGLSMPMQKIETIDQPRSEAAAKGQLAMFERQAKRMDDFRNRLIWGDNKPVMASLLKEFKGSVDLIYIDPPFDVGEDFTMDVPIGDQKETVKKDQSTLEMVAYQDMWGKDVDSYLHTMFERLTLMLELLSDDGSIVVHCDWHVNFQLRSLLNQMLGVDRFKNEIVWYYYNKMQGNVNRFAANHDTLLWYTKGRQYHFYKQQEQREEAVQQLKRVWDKDSGKVVNAKDEEGGVIYIEATEKTVDDVWRIPMLQPADLTENVGYATQKPVELAGRIIDALTKPDDLILDAFAGSGTTLVAAEGLRTERDKKNKKTFYTVPARRWIGCDLGRFSIHTTRKRLIDLQRQLHNEGKPYRAFDVHNLGRYERQWWQQASLKGADEEHRRVVLEFFQAEQLSNAPSPLIHGRKGRAFCHVASIDSMFSRDQARAVAKAVAATGGQECYCLAWEFEMDLRLTLSALEQETGVKLKPIPIPREIMERNRKSPPPFLEMAVLEAEPVYRGGKTNRTVDIKLTKFLPSLAEVPTKELEALKERAVKSGFDFIDFWAIDFDWHPEKPFNHHWQDYRTRKDRSLKTVSEAGHKYPGPGKYTACVKVVDVFGCDTSITVEVTI